jgi:DNA replication and repair protein RecF
VLALVLAEAGLVSDRRGEPPLLLLDDVFSELDRARGEALVAQLPTGSQTVVTATERPSVLAPDLVVEVTPGRARAA